MSTFLPAHAAYSKALPAEEYIKYKIYVLGGNHTWVVWKKLQMKYSKISLFDVLVVRLYVISDKLPRPQLKEYILLIGKLSNRINDDRMRETFSEQILWMRSVIENVQKEHESEEITEDIVREAKKRVCTSE